MPQVFPREEQNASRSDIDAVLTEWKRRAIEVIYLAIAVFGFAANIAEMIIDVLPHPEHLPVALVFWVLYLGLLALLLVRKGGARVRGWALLVVFYAAGLLSLARGSLAGDGRLILMILPVFALILLDRRAAIVTFVVSVLTLVAFAALAGLGLGTFWLRDALRTDPFGLFSWVVEGFYTTLAMLLLFVLVAVFNRFILNLIEIERQAQREVEHARHDMEDARRANQEELAERTHELEERLAASNQARAAAESSEQAKRQLISTLSHDLRNPLGAMTGLAGLLEDTSLDTQQQELVALIRSSANSMTEQVSRLLEYSRIESGRLQLEETSAPLRPLLQKAVESAQAACAEHATRLSLSLADDLPESLLCDEGRVVEALSDVLAAAVRESDSHEVGLSVTGGGEGQSASDAPTLRFSVQSRARSISPAFVQRLLDPLSNRAVDKDVANLPVGNAGLGLAVARLLAEKMGGSLKAQTDGANFEFTFVLPARMLPAPVRQSAILEPRTAPRLGGRARAVEKRVLLVQPNDDARRTLTLQAQAWGMAPKAAERVEIAADWLRSGECFDVAVIDLKEEVSDAIALLQAASSAASPGRSLPLLVIGSAGDQRGAAGIHELARPYTASGLYEALSGILSMQAPEYTEPKTLPIAFDTHLGERHPLKILVVEDNLVNRNMVSQLLKRLGYDPTVTSNGLEAVEVTEQTAYDLILMDVQMPVMDGVEATRKIRAAEQNGRAHIVAMTARVLPGDREACLEAGMDDYLGKPLRVEDLVEAIRRCPLRKAPATPQAPEPQIDGEVLDRSELERLKKTLGARAEVVLATLISNFQRQVEMLLAEIETNAAQGKMDAALIAAATLKTNSLSFGALRLAKMAEALQETKKEDLPRVLHQTREEYLRLKEAL